MSWIVSLNKPWLHFIVLGAVLFYLQSVFFPEPKTVIWPLSEARVNRLQEQWLTSTGRNPTPTQVGKFIAAELDRDMLFQRALELEFHLYDTIVYQQLIRNMKFLQMAVNKTDTELFDQALEMRLHLDDEVVKRRLIQLVEGQLLADNPTTKPSADKVAAAFTNRKEELRRPPLYTIEHVFFNREREPEVAAIIATITEQKLDVRSARQLGSPFLQGYQFTRKTPDQLAQNFGNGFVFSLKQALNASQVNSQQWLGPLPSVYGLHYVWVAEYQPERDVLLREVEQQLRHDLEYAAKNQALRCAIAVLRKEYDVRGQDQNASDLKDLDEKDREGCQ
ncbi:MAG: hypothetical protein JKY88_00270 [Pseudomonadales bacterium]|nr:hypothetical protein [Pseudomonadales bacterium]